MKKLIFLGVFLFCFICSSTAWGGTYFTRSNLVTLRLSFLDSSFWAQMRFSNNNQSWSEPEPIALTRNWDVTAYGGKTGDGIKCIYLETQNKDGDWGPTISACLIVDKTPPIGSIGIKRIKE